MDNDDTTESGTRVPASLSSEAPPSVGLSEFVLHHTWSIRLLSKFVAPLPNVQKSCGKLEQDIARFIQNQRRDLRQEDGNGDNLLQIEEIVVQLFWGDPAIDGLKTKQCSGEEGSASHSRSQSTDGSSETDDQMHTSESRKRRKGEKNTQSTPTYKSPRQQHLIIDTRTQEGGLLAEIVCSYPQFIDNPEQGEDVGKIKGFDFLLTRGSKRSIEAVLGWLESATKCRTARSVFLPSNEDVARATTLWTFEHWQLTKDHTVHKNENSSEAVATSTGETNAIEDNDTSDLQATKPLTLAYQVPSGPAGEAGLESISLTVPPVALLRLCNNIMTCLKKGGSRSNEPEPRPPESIPIVKALQCFLRETFCIHIEKFALIRASCSAAILDCDGRCKPLCATLLPEILQEIQFMVQNRTQEEDEEE